MNKDDPEKSPRKIKWKRKEEKERRKEKHGKRKPGKTHSTANLATTPPVKKLWTPASCPGNIGAKTVASKIAMCEKIPTSDQDPEGLIDIFQIFPEQFFKSPRETGKDQKKQWFRDYRPYHDIVKTPRSEEFQKRRSICLAWKSSSQFWGQIFWARSKLVCKVQ